MTNDDQSPTIPDVMPFTRRFEEISKQDVALAGGKGASLGEMTQAGIPVPPGFVILSAAFERFLEETDIGVEVDAILHTVDHQKMHTVENASEKIHALIVSAKMPKDIEKEIWAATPQPPYQGAFRHPPDKGERGGFPVAVRSSATSEDSSTAAWAGQLDSFLNTTEATLIENVKKCWASLFTPRAIFYRFEKNLHEQKISVAVVIQQMIQSEVSGIAFSVHPVTQDRNQLIIEAGIGLGEAIVSGQITPDSYVVEKDSWKILNKNVSEQKRALYRSPAGGNEWKNLGVEGKQKLSDAEIIELSRLVVKIENHYGFPVDVEWAREGGKFYVLQSRPITTLNDRSEIPPFTLDPQKYERLFQVGGMPFIISDIFSEHYKTLRCLLLYSDETWRSFLPKKVVEQTLQSGYELFKTAHSFSKYQNGFEKYKKTSSRFFHTTLKQKKITEAQLKKFLDFMAGLFIFYSKTEFFYTDKAFMESETHPTLKKNLVALEQIKNSGREYLNKIFFGKESWLSQLLAILGRQFNVDPNGLIQYSREDLLELFHGRKVDAGTVSARLENYLFQCDGPDCTILAGNEALVSIFSFLNQSRDLHGTLKGVSANKGLVRGRVKIILSGYDNFDRLKHVIAEMQPGDILVAETTSPELMVACRKAGGIVTNQGGLMSHAAIVSREMNIPCIVGTGNATEILKDGNMIELDGHNGIITLINP